MKKWIAVCLALILCLSLCACAEKPAEPADAQTPAEAPVQPKQAEQPAAEPETPAAPAVEELPAEPEEETQEAVMLSIGDKIENESFTMTFDSMEILPEYSYRTSDYSSTSLYVEDGYELLLIKGHIENTGTTTISDSCFSKSVVVNGSYTVTDYDVRLSFMRAKYFEIDPYTDLDYFLYINIPQKLADQFETAAFTLGFNNDLSYPVTNYRSDGTKTIDVDNLYTITGGVSGAQSGDAATSEETPEEPAAPEVQELAVGGTVKTELWEITLAKAETATEIHPVDPGATGTYYQSSEGRQFMNLEFDIKNLDTEVRAFSDAVSDVVVHCGKYDYNGYAMYYDMGGSLSVTLLKGTTHGPAPLDPTHLYVETDIPDEAAGMDSITVDLIIAGIPYHIVVK